MATPKEQEKLEEEKENRMTLDFTKPELEYIKENANFTVEELTIFEMLTGKYGRETIVYIANKTNLSTATVSRRIKKIKKWCKKRTAFNMCIKISGVKNGLIEVQKIHQGKINMSQQCQKQGNVMAIFLCLKLVQYN